MGEIGYFWKNADNQLPAEAGLVQHAVKNIAQIVLYCNNITFNKRLSGLILKRI